MLSQALLAGLPLLLIGAAVVIVHSLARIVLVVSWAVAAAIGARAAAQLFRLMLSERSGGARYSGAAKSARPKSRPSCASAA